jgi:hypothetical protein
MSQDPHSEIDHSQFTIGSYTHPLSALFTAARISLMVIEPVVVAVVRRQSDRAI